MSIYLWHNQINLDPCLNYNYQAQITDYFNGSNLHNRKMLPAYALEFSPATFLEQLFELVLTINHQLFHFQQFKIFEYGEIPLEYPHGLIAYQLVVQAKEFPRGEWMHIFIDAYFQIFGIRIAID
ncbi:MAG: hypothetical protein LCH85_00005 [Chloroflexi bacterium]|nr:hypothetical protein [Chloroflexota bacterium]